MIKKTNKVAANKVVLTVKDNELVIIEYDKEGYEQPPILMKEFAEDLLDKEFVNITISYDQQMN